MIAPQPSPLSKCETVVKSFSTSTDWHPRTLQEIKEQGHDVSGPIVRIYTNCVFDMLHIGHASSLLQMKEQIPNSYLIVGVCSDEDTLEFKPGATVLKTEQRAKMLTHLKYVDEVLIDPPYIPPIKFIDSLRCDLVGYNAKYPIVSQFGDVFLPFKDADRFIGTERTDGISTTGIIQRILDNSELFRERQAVRLAENWD